MGGASVSSAQTETNLQGKSETDTASLKTVYAVYGQGSADDYLPDEKEFVAADYVRPGMSRTRRSSLEMNIPEGFSIIGMMVLLSVFIGVVGLMINDVAKEDKIIVKEISGNLNC